MPKFSHSLRAIELTKFSELYEHKISKSTGYRYVLITDITSFFPTIYTHTITWAIHGKDIAKDKTRNKKNYLGDRIDAGCMGVQDRQTIGLPIGPDTSHIIAEIIGVSIDLELKKNLGRWPHGFRYVDDYYLFFDERDQAESCLAELTKAIGSYELQINPAKTKIVEVKEIVEDSWKYRVKKLEISNVKRIQRDDIHNYFEYLFSLEKRFSDESLVKYGLKQISSKIIRKSNWKVFEAYLLKCGFSFPNTLQVIANILSTYNHHEYDLSISEIKRFCNNLIKIHARSDHHNEVSWLLWICKDLKLNITKDAVRSIEGMSSSVCILLVLDLYNSRIITTNVTAKYLKQFSNKNSLYGPGWILSYEAGRRFWLKNSDDNYIKNDHFFGALLKENVIFYDETKKCSPIFDFKPAESSNDFDFDLFDSDEDIEDYFDYDEMDEEYFDSNSPSEEENDDNDDEDSDDEELVNNPF